MAEAATTGGGIALIDLITGAWKVFKENFLTILIITLIVQIPLSLAVQGIDRIDFLSGQQSFVNHQSNLIRNNKSSEVDVPGYVRATVELAGVAVAIHFFGSLGGALSFMAIVLVVKATREDRKVNYMEALRKALPMWPAALITLLMIEIMLSVLFALFIVPGIYFYVFWTFAIQMVVIYGKWGWGAVASSAELVKGRWWRVFGFSLVLGLMAAAAGGLIGAFNFKQGVYISDTVFAVIASIVASYFIVAYSLFFFDMEATRPASQAPPQIEAAGEESQVDDQEK